MIRKQFLLLAIFLFSITALAQFNLNDYKYVVIPRQFDFLKYPDQYQVNSLTKFLLEKENFIVLIDDVNPPKDLASNSCLALYGNVLDGSKLFRTKLSFTLKDCNNNEVFTTQEGASKEKNFQKAYHEALRNAFKSFDAINYSFQPKKVEEKVVEAMPKKEVIKKEVVEIVQPKREFVLESEQLSQNKDQKVEKDTVDKDVLFAKWTGLGFKVYDENSVEVMVLLTTAKPDVFIVKDKNAIISKNEKGFWIYSENDGQSLQARAIDIKF